MCVYKDQRKGMNGLEEGYKMLCYKMFQPFSKVITMCTFSTVLENKIKKVCSMIIMKFNILLNHKEMTKIYSCFYKL